MEYKKDNAIDKGKKNLKLAIMQPYFLPYIGYWQLMNYVDVFVVYDNIQYTKKGWINRNRYLCNGVDKYFTIPLRKDSDFLDVKDRYISETFDRNKLINQVRMAYGKAPYFERTYDMFEKIVSCEETNLFQFLYYSIGQIKDLLQISTELVVSSSLNINVGLKGKEKVQEICNVLGAHSYINPIGGVDLYDKDDFKKKGIELSFLQTDYERINYKQFEHPFIPALSILDTLMFNSLDEVDNMLSMYKVI